jgi:hypothetical protein
MGQSQAVCPQKIWKICGNPLISTKYSDGFTVLFAALPNIQMKSQGNRQVILGMYYEDVRVRKQVGNTPCSFDISVDGRQQFLSGPAL